MEHISFELDGHRATESSWNLQERRLRSCRAGGGGGVHARCNTTPAAVSPLDATPNDAFTLALEESLLLRGTFDGKERARIRGNGSHVNDGILCLVRLQPLLHARASNVVQPQDFEEKGIPRVRCNCSRQLLLHACDQCPVQNHMASARAPIHRNAPTSQQKPLFRRNRA